MNRRLLWLLSLIVALFLARVLPAEDVLCPTSAARVIRERDQIWLVNTRGVDCGATEPASLTYSRLESKQWQPAAAATFFATDDKNIPTLFYIHGNRKDAPGAEFDGLETYHELVGKFPDERAVRFVIWSWPSDQIKRRPRQDVYVKAARSDVDAELLARFLASLQPDSRVSVVSFSFGSRIFSGASHLLGGGELNGVRVAASHRPTMRGVLWAAAIHDDWLLPGHPQGCALPVTEKWLNLINPCDSVLRQYHRLDKCAQATALGYGGLAGRETLDPTLASRFQQVDVSTFVGSEHDTEPYLYNGEVARLTREGILWRDAGLASESPR